MKNFFVIVICIFIGIIFTGCGGGNNVASPEETPSEQRPSSKQIAQEQMVNYFEYDIRHNTDSHKDTEVWVFVDPETGINYFIAHGKSHTGMTVRLNPDGSPMITK